MVKQFNNGEIVPPPAKTGEQVQKEKEQSIENNKYVNRLFRGDKGTIQKTLIFGVPLGVLAYSAYKIPKLPDHQPKEVLKAGALAVGGSFLAISIAAGSAMGGGGGKKTNILYYGLIGTSVAGFTYLASRSIFISQNPKMSLKYGLGFGLATIALLFGIIMPKAQLQSFIINSNGNQVNYDLDIKFREIFGNKYPTRIDPSKLVWGNGIIASAEYLNYIAFFYNNEAIGNEPNNSISLSDGSFGGAFPVYNLKTGWIIGYSYNQSGIDKFVKF